MKYQCLVIFATFFLVHQIHAETPHQKCNREWGRTQEGCITHCTYKHYGFSDNNYRITKKHIEKLRDILIEYKAVPLSDKSKITGHIRACADRANAKKPKSTEDKCKKIIHYYRCVVDGKTLTWNRYAHAMIPYEKTFNL
uniref:LolSOBPa n=1 Tax=Bichromomyia olmeca TaxID=715919 RepID=A0A1B1V3H5_9DIPT|nr:LolSOBPa [Bichromomyia olmeca]